jgi:hypothetical protein
VESQTGRERAVHEALVTAQELRADIRGQAQREADLVLAEAQAEVRQKLAQADDEARAKMSDTDRRLVQAQDLLAELERRRSRFLQSFRHLLEREMDVVQVESERPPLEERTIDMELGAKPRVEEAPEPPPPLPTVSPRSVLLGDDIDTSPPLDMPVDQLYAAYAEAEGAANGPSPATSAPKPKPADLFSPPPFRQTLGRDDDGRWG